MSRPADIVDAFRHLQAGDGAAALEIASGIARAQPSNARAHLAKGIALRVLGRMDEARASLERAASLDPQDYAIAYEAGVAHDFQGDTGAAIAQYERAVRLRPAFLPAHRALAPARLALGDFDRAAEAYGAALALAPGDAELSMLLAQAELARGRYAEGWAAYAHRAQRRHYEAQFAAQGARYRVPALAQVAGRDVTIVGEQGLGDNLFFLRFAPALAAAGARLAYVGDARLHPLLARTGLFAALHADTAAHALGTSIPVLLADLPAVTREASAFPASLAIAPDPHRLEQWRRTLEATGPRPWTGVTWRAGTPTDVLARGLLKNAPLAPLFAALAPAGGTVLAIQRAPAAGEIAAAGGALGRAVHDFARINDELEDALAVCALLDRHVGVSNTNMHLAAAAGREADVLVPFPPEWRWGIEGTSPWFPGFRVYRQRPGGDWSGALAALAAHVAAAGAPRG